MWQSLTDADGDSDGDTHGDANTDANCDSDIDTYTYSYYTSKGYTDAETAADSPPAVIAVIGKTGTRETTSRVPRLRAAGFRR